jgi:tryptophan synthase alpha chain
MSGLIIPDVPLDEADRLSAIDLEVIPMLAPSSGIDRIISIARKDPSFVYCVSVRGTTGVRALPEKEITEYLDAIKQHCSAPLALGFGISGPRQVEQFKGHCDAFVVGSLLVNIIKENIKHPERMLLKLEDQVAQLKNAARQLGQEE